MARTCLLFLTHFDFHIYASWKAEVGERIDGFWGWFEDIDHALMCAHFELLAAVFMNESRTQYCVFALRCRKRHWSGDGGTSSLGGINDLLCALIDKLMIICADLDANFGLVFGLFHKKLTIADLAFIRIFEPFTAIKTTSYKLVELVRILTDYFSIVKWYLEKKWRISINIDKKHLIWLK